MGEIKISDKHGLIGIYIPYHEKDKVFEENRFF